MTTHANSWPPSLSPPTLPGTIFNTSAKPLPTTASPWLSTPMAWPCPDSSLLDLHLALHLGRRVNADHQIDFLGRSWPISATPRHSVTLIHHPHSQFWVVSQPPKPPQNRWPDILGKFS